MLSAIVTALLEQHGDHPVVRDGRPLPTAHTVSAVHVSNRWLGRVVLVLFRPGDRRPWLVVKLDRHAPYADRSRAELAVLEAMAATGRFDRDVPRPVGMLTLDAAVGMVQSALPGRPLTSVLRSRWRPGVGAWARDHARARSWQHRLATWPEVDAVTPGRVVDVAAEVDALLAVVGPATEADGSGGRAAAGRLRDAARAVGEVREPVVRVHGDLAPSNLLLRRGSSALVDWEGSRPDGSRLEEGLVFLHHHVRATPLAAGRLPSRAEAIVRAFAGDDALGRLTRRSWRHVVAEAGLDPALADVLLLAVLGRLASGTARQAHARRAQRMWAASAPHLLAAYAAAPEGWPPR